MNVLFLGTLVPPGSARNSSEELDTYNILVGEILSIETMNPKRVAVRDPAVVDIVKVAKSSIEVIGKTEGKTDVTIYDGEGTRTYSITVYGEDLLSLKDRIREMLKQLNITDEIKIKEDEVSRKLMIVGELYDKDLERVNNALAPVNKYIANFLTTRKKLDSVRIDVQVLELNKNETQQLGMQWPDHFSVREEPYTAPSTTTTTGGVVTTFGKIGTPPQAFRFMNISRDAITLTINTLITQHKGKILSRPQIICLSGEEAKIVVGGELPVETSTATDQGTTTSTTYKEYGIKLKIKPEVMPDDRIRMKLDTEVSEIDSNNTFTNSTGTKVWAFLKREASTQLFFESGQTLAIGGMISNNENNDVTKFPFLNEIPILGALFRSKDYRSGQSELVLLLTPELIRAPEPKNKAVQQADEGKDAQAAEAQKAVADPSVYSIPDSSMLGYKQSAKKEFFSQAVTNYIYTIQRLITESLKNPPLCEDSSWESALKLRLHILADGTLMKAEVLEHSGYRLFDEYVLETAKKINPYPYFAPEMAQEDIWIEIPVVYAKD